MDCPYYLHALSYFQAYALVAKGVRLVCSNKTGKNAKSVVLNTQGSDSLKDNIITVFGMNTFTCLEPVTICMSDDCKVDGFLSKPGQGSGRNLGDRQYYFVNGRPVDMPKVSKLVNEIYKGANSRQYPIAIMNFTVPTRACDVNVTPDKRKIFFSDESSILLALREGLEKIYSPSNACYSVNKFEEHAKAVDSSQLCSTREKSHMLAEQLSANGRDCEEIQMDEHMSVGSNPLIPVEIKSQPLHVGERLIHNIDEKFTAKDFTLRVHGTNKVASPVKSNFRQLTTRLNSVTDQNAPSSSTVVEKGIAENRDSKGPLCFVQSNLNKFVTVNKRKHEDISSALSEVPVLRNQAPQCQLKQNNSGMHAAVISFPVNHHQIDDSGEVSEIEPPKCRREDTIFNKIKNSFCSRGTTDDGKFGEVCSSKLQFEVVSSFSCIDCGKQLLPKLLIFEFYHFMYRIQQVRKKHFLLLMSHQLILLARVLKVYQRIL